MDEFLKELQKHALEALKPDFEKGAELGKGLVAEYQQNPELTVENVTASIGHVMMASGAPREVIGNQNIFRLTAALAWATSELAKHQKMETQTVVE